MATSAQSSPPATSTATSGPTAADGRRRQPWRPARPGPTFGGTAQVREAPRRPAPCSTRAHRRAAVPHPDMTADPRLEAPPRPSFDAGHQARGSAQPTGSLFDAGAQGTGPVRGSARPAGGTYGAAAVPGAGPEPTGTFRDTDPQVTGTFRDAQPPRQARSVMARRPTGTFRDGQPPTGTFRDGQPPTGTFRDRVRRPPAPSVTLSPLRRARSVMPLRRARSGTARPPATGTFRDGAPAAGGSMFASGGSVSGPAYGEGPAYGNGPGYDDAPAGPSFGAGQASGRVYRRPGGRARLRGHPGTRPRGDPRAGGPVRGAGVSARGAGRAPEVAAARGDAAVEERGCGRRTAIILGALAALVIGAGTAGAATFLSGDDPAPATSQARPR